MGLEQAEVHLATARKHLERVQDAVGGIEEDHEAAVTWAFYAYENCVSALAEAFDQPLTHNHVQKAQLARRQYAERMVSQDIGDLLEELNRLRKDVEYGMPGSDLTEMDLEELSGGLETFIDEVDSCMDAKR